MPVIRTNNILTEQREIEENLGLQFTSADKAIFICPQCRTLNFALYQNFQRLHQKVSALTRGLHQHAGPSTTLQPRRASAVTGGRPSAADGRPPLPSLPEGDATVDLNRLIDSFLADSAVTFLVSARPISSGAGGPDFSLSASKDGADVVVETAPVSFGNYDVSTSTKKSAGGFLAAADFFANCKFNASSSRADEGNNTHNQTFTVNAKKKPQSEV